MYILVGITGSADSGEYSIDLVGVFRTLREAREKMAYEYDAFMEVRGWDHGDHRLRRTSAYMMDGDIWDHDYYEAWNIFDSDRPTPWFSAID